ncbi:MAG TPA: hypothetical protein PKW24_01110 [Clostridiales bacterium]|jgi:hypothetical protein|nr:hypothetical protein [Clostridiales bacterium]
MVLIPGFTKAELKENAKYWISYLSFLSFGLVVPFTKSKLSALTFIVSIVLALLLAFLTPFLSTLLLTLLNRPLKEVDALFAYTAVADGMLFMLPFAIMALTARFALGWGAVMPFASTGLTTAMATAGAELAGKGGKGFLNMMIPSLLALVFSTVWILLCGLLP